jgi:transposase
MLRIKLTEDEKEEVLRQRFAHPSPKVQKRMEALHLRTLGKSYSDIMEIIGCSRASVYRWLTIFSETGIEGLKTIEYTRAEGALTPHRESLEEYFKNNPPSSIREAIVRIKDITGVERSERVVREFLRSIGMSYRKTGRVPGKANRQAQEEFKKKAWSHS